MDLLFTFSLILLASVIGAALILKLIVRVRGRVSSEPNFNRPPSRSSTLLPLAFRVVGGLPRLGQRSKPSY
jgi:hypothetical protein